MDRKIDNTSAIGANVEQMMVIPIVPRPLVPDDDAPDDQPDDHAPDDQPDVHATNDPPDDDPPNVPLANEPVAQAAE